MTDPLKPSAALLCKIGSAVVHADELVSADGHHLDRAALLSAIQDPDVQAWLRQMGELALVPLKRRKS